MYKQLPRNKKAYVVLHNSIVNNDARLANVNICYKHVK